MDVSKNDLHEHLKKRMKQRGVSFEELKQTLQEGWEAKDTKPGTLGKTHVFEYNDTWQGTTYRQKEVSVYYKKSGEEIILLTVKARYGKNF